MTKTYNLSHDIHDSNMRLSILCFTEYLSGVHMEEYALSL